MKRVKPVNPHSLCVQPTFIIGTYNEDGSANFAPITWVSITKDIDHYLLIISMKGLKKTKQNISNTHQLSANIVSTDMLELLDYFGSHSALNGLKQAIPYDYEDGLVLPVPTLNLSRCVYECEVSKTVETGDTKTYFCVVRNIQVIEELRDVASVDLNILDPVIYSGDYYAIGYRLGSIGEFSKID